jgi:hypothetical protein
MVRLITSAEVNAHITVDTCERMLTSAPVPPSNRLSRLNVATMAPIRARCRAVRHLRLQGGAGAWCSVMCRASAAGAGAPTPQAEPQADLHSAAAVRAPLPHVRLPAPHGRPSVPQARMQPTTAAVPRRLAPRVHGRPCAQWWHAAGPLGPARVGAGQPPRGQRVALVFTRVARPLLDG